MIRTFALIASALILTTTGCEKPGRCDVVVMEGCTAQCKRTDGDKVCSDTLILSRSGTNAILKQKSKNIVLENIGDERCFSVSDGTISDTAALDDLMSQCQTALKKAEKEPE